VAGATVTLTNMGTNEQRKTQSGGNGDYQFVNLPGAYGVSIDNAGFKRFTRSPVTVHVEAAVRIDAVLQVGDNSQTVEVTEQTPLRQTQTAIMG
jgi:hypothetical protein